jgi:AraC family transcriptional activator FtrA
MRQRRRVNREVAVLAYNGLGTFELGIVVEIFGLPRPEFDEWYRFKVCGLESGPLHATGGLKILPQEGIRGLSTAGTIIIPGWRTDEQPPTPLLNALLRAHGLARSRIPKHCATKQDLGSEPTFPVKE